MKCWELILDLMRARQGLYYHISHPQPLFAICLLFVVVLPYLIPPPHPVKPARHAPVDFGGLMATHSDGPVSSACSLPELHVLQLWDFGHASLLSLFLYSKNVGSLVSGTDHS